jgi:DNA-directed RNA polymerase specialized sigma24 family protein
MPDRWEDAQDRSVQELKIRKALGAIPSAHRRVLVDHFIHGRPVKAIAHRERIPVGTVLSRIFTAKRLLREAWD